jgi:hypothetical protein
MLKYVPLNNIHFSTFNCGVPCHGREREERERERKKQRRVGSFVSELNKTFKKKPNKPLFHFFGGKKLQKYVFSKIGCKSAINCPN